MRYWFPYPLLSLSLLMLWLLVNRSVSPGQILLGTVLGVSLGWAMVNIKPRKSRVRTLSPIATLLVRIVADVVRSNIAVAATILRLGRHPVQSGFVTIDLTLTDENAIAFLACILTATPGSAWIEFDRQRKTLVIHVLDLEAGTAFARSIATRYEAPLKAIFE